MTSHERVLATVNHRDGPGAARPGWDGQQPASTSKPTLACGTPSGFSGRCSQMGDVWQMLAWVEDPVVGRAACGCADGGARSVPAVRVAQRCLAAPGARDDGTLVQMPANFAPVTEADGSLCLYTDGELVAKKAGAGVYFDRMIEFKAYDPLPPVESFKIPLFTDEDLAWRRRSAETLRRATDKALIRRVQHDPGRLGILPGVDVQDQQRTRITCGHFTTARSRSCLPTCNSMREAVGDNIDIFGLGEDFGTQKGLMISPRMFREMVAPYYRRLFDWVHRNTSWKVHFPLLRWDLPDHRHPDRLRRGYPEPGADLRRRDGAGKVETGIRGQAGLLRCTTHPGYRRSRPWSCRSPRTAGAASPETRSNPGTGGPCRVWKGVRCRGCSRSVDHPGTRSGIAAAPQDLARQALEGECLCLSEEGARPAEQFPGDLLGDSRRGSHYERAPRRGLLPPSDNAAQLARVRRPEHQAQAARRHSAAAGNAPAVWRRDDS